MKLLVGVADMKVSNRSADTIITYGLGSCLGIVIYDPVARVGGMLHVMLPCSGIDRDKAVANPFMFVDTGVPRLLHASYDLGAVRQRLQLKVAGGACPNGAGTLDCFQIGKRNVHALVELLQAQGIPVRAHRVAGHHSRSMSLDVASGRVVVRSHAGAEDL